MDLLFFPIDTVKTRLQSSQGFAQAGGLKGIYKGVGSVVVGSAPGGPTRLYRFSNDSRRSRFFNTCSGCVLRHVRYYEANLAISRPHHSHAVRVYWRDRKSAGSFVPSIN